jgi:hypothetical protein
MIATPTVTTCFTDAFACILSVFEVLDQFAPAIDMTTDIAAFHSGKLRSSTNLPSWLILAHGRLLRWLDRGLVRRNFRWAG